MIQRSLRQIYKTVSKGYPTPHKFDPDDPWKGCESDYYISNFREVIEEFALEQSSLNHEVLVRFIPRLKCAELYIQGSQILAQINIRGEMGTATYASVTLFNISPKAAGELGQIFPFRVEFSK